VEALSMSSETFAANIEMHGTAGHEAEIAQVLSDAGFAGVSSVVDGETYVTTDAIRSVCGDMKDLEPLGVAYRVIRLPYFDDPGVIRIFTPDLGVFEKDCDESGEVTLSASAIESIVRNTVDEKLSAALDRATGGPHRRHFRSLVHTGERKYFKTIVVVEVLSQDAPWSDDYEFSDLSNAITDGPCSGAVRIHAVEELDGPAAAQALMAQGSDPEFFSLDEDGIEIDD
jgi:hypothetical protein